MSTQAELMPMGQLRWRCRRGMRELDVLLLKFLESRYEGLDQAQKETFEAVLQLQDPDLYAMLTGKLVPESPEIRQMIDLLLEVSSDNTLVG
ncbi:MAG: succinate dehydrogenase assembly factor 2 [Gammaproteobacteria bacterium]|nr:succinate dehydrogenase assembly factor 2 [Gammaproteobacteria bacterium]